VTGGLCKEVIRRDGFSLSDFPILHCWPRTEGDSSRCRWSFAQSRHGQANCGMYRMQVFDERTTGMHWQTHKQGAEHYRRMKALGRNTRMDVAVAIGADPATMYSAILPLPPDLDEMMIAAFCVEAGRDGQVRDGRSGSAGAFGNRARSYVELGELRREGPFGDHTGFYSLEDDYPVFHVTCVTHRKDPIYAPPSSGPADGRLLHGQSHRTHFSAPDAIAVA